MKANELRIGNWISFKGMWNGQIEHFSPVHMVIKDNGGFFGFDEFEPIPITEDWLLKFGFSRNVDYYLHLFRNDYSMYFDRELKNITIVKNEDKDLPEFYVDHVHFVHQLENLYFALTGTELNYTP